MIKQTVSSTQLIRQRLPSQFPSGKLHSLVAMSRVHIQDLQEVIKIGGVVYPNWPFCMGLGKKATAICNELYAISALDVQSDSILNARLVDELVPDGSVSEECNRRKCLLSSGCSVFAAISHDFSNGLVTR
jgi:hypothetical protein